MNEDIGEGGGNGRKRTPETITLKDAIPVPAYHDQAASHRLFTVPLPSLNRPLPTIHQPPLPRQGIFHHLLPMPLPPLNKPLHNTSSPSHHLIVTFSYLPHQPPTLHGTSRSLPPPNTPWLPHPLFKQPTSHPFLFQTLPITTSFSPLPSLPHQSPPLHATFRFPPPPYKAVSHLSIHPLFTFSPGQLSPLHR